ncbi:O-antigen ligase family protein [Patescibacteria group bacterium]|nr:O-antigen ligase family protein [Patescibacteria group bacterium]
MKTDNILKNIVLGSIFLVPFIPFIVPNNLFFPFITGKAFAFRILVEIIVGLWAILALRNESYRPKFSWITVAAAVFVVIIGIADVFGENPMKSIWSNFERMEGWVTLLHLFGFFVATTAVLRTEKLWHRFFNISIVASVLMGFYGLMQMAGKFDIHQSSDRLDATLGNSAYLAVYMLFHIFITSFFLVRERGNSLLKWLYGLALILQVVVLYNTGTRGAILGLLAGSLVVNLFVAIFEKQNKKLKKISIGFLVGIVALVGLFIGLRESPFVQNSPVLERLAKISLEERTTKSRFMVWGTAWEGFKENPVLGWGQENFSYVFDKYYNPGMYDQEQWFDRTHNVFFDWLIAGGLLGLLGYLALFASIIYYLFKDENNYFNILDKGIILGLLTAYFVHNLFVFDHLISYILFFSLLGYMHSINVEEENISTVKINKGVNNIAIPAVIIVALFSVYFFNAKPIMANMTLLSALKPQEEGAMKNLAYYQKAISIGFVGRQEAREQLAQFGIQFASSELSPELKQEMFNIVVGEMENQIEEDPNSARIESIAGTFLGRVGDLDGSLIHLERALELSPNKVSLLELAGNVNLFKGDFAEATEYFKKAFESAPQFNLLRIGYASGLIYLEEDKQAEEILVPVFGTVLVDDDRIIQAYLARRDYEKAIAILEKRVADKPGDGQSLLSLAAVYAEAGYKTKAVEAIRGVI